MSSYSIQPYIFMLLLVVICGSIACSGTRPTDIERGSEYNYTHYTTEEGDPELRLTAMGYLNEENEGVIDVAADIENRSLIYRHLDGKTTADIEIVITVVGTEGERHLDSYTETKTIENDIHSHIITANVTRYEKDVNVPPGRYKVFFSVTDKASDSQTIREVYTTVPDTSEETVSLTSVQLFGKTPDEPGRGYEAVTTYDVSTKKDSIRFVLQVNNNTDKPIAIHSRLIRFEADTAAARPASHANYSASSLPYRGIDYRNEENLEQTRRVLDQTGVVMIEFYYERPKRGSYRFEVTTEGADDDDELYTARDFSVKGENFPRIKSPRELAEPLIYLMNRREHEELMAIEDPEELKEAVDRFWLENIGSVNSARLVISRYYERVEEANRQFTNFKEGWKTDRGMVYILFGPPVRIDEWLNGQQWLGSLETRDSRYNFIFHRARVRSNYYPFDNYILQRSQGYHTYLYQQVQLWLSGGILQATM